MDEAKTTLCGTKAGADMKDGLRINRVQYGRQCVEKPDLSSGGVDYFDGEAESVQDVEQRVFSRNTPQVGTALLRMAWALA